MMYTLGCAVIWLSICCLYDFAFRRIPNPVIVCGLACGWYYTNWSWWGFGTTLVVLLVAGFPGGDVKGMAILGGIVGMLPITCTLYIAFMVTLLVWKRRTILYPWMILGFASYLLEELFRVLAVYLVESMT